MKITEAYYDQTHNIGWEAFHRGRASVKWEEAYCMFGSQGHRDATVWLSDVIRSSLDYTLQLWEHRNTVLHGKDTEEKKHKE
jgi:hypothetical protein